MLSDTYAMFTHPTHYPSPSENPPIHPTQPSCVYLSYINLHSIKKGMGWMGRWVELSIHKGFLNPIPCPSVAHPLVTP